MKIGVYILGLVAVCWWFYHMGENAANLTCQETLTELSAQSIESKRISDEAIRNEETLRVSQDKTEAARVSDIHRRRESVKRNQSPVPSDNRLPNCRLSDARIGLLREATSNPALPEARDPASINDTKVPAL